jgi:hypothetical protein
VIGGLRHDDVVVGERAKTIRAKTIRAKTVRAKTVFEFGANPRPALAAIALVGHRIDDDLGFHGNSVGDDRTSLVSAETEINLKATSSPSAQIF